MSLQNDFRAEAWLCVNTNQSREIRNILVEVATAISDDETEWAAKLLRRAKRMRRLQRITRALERTRRTLGMYLASLKPSRDEAGLAIEHSREEAGT